MLKAEVMETLLFVCAMWTLGKERFAECTIFVLRIIVFQRRHRTERLMSYAKALKKTQCESVETTICKRHLLLFTGAAQRTNNERLTRRVMLGTMAGGENPGPGRPKNNWDQCLVDDFRVFRATEGSTESSPLVFGVDTVLWPTAAKNGEKWYRRVVVAAD